MTTTPTFPRRMNNARRRRRFFASSVSKGLGGGDASNASSIASSAQERLLEEEGKFLLKNEVLKTLEKGLSYEIRTGCLNARGKKYSNFEEFLTAQLTLLSEDAAVKNSVKSSAMVRRMKEDGVLYGRLPASERERMLTNMKGALPIVLAEVSSNASDSKGTRNDERSASGNESSTSGGGLNGSAQVVAGWQPPPSAKRTASSPPPSSSSSSSSSSSTSSSSSMKSLGVLSSSTVRKETSSSVASKQPIVEAVKDKKMPTVIVFDLETTGLSKERDRIVEIACVDLSDVTSAASVAGDGTDIKNFQTLVNPGRFSIPSHVQKLTGITNAMVSAPDIPSFQMAAERFEAFIEAARLKNKESGDGAYSGEVLLAAHNARQFDSSFLQREYWRLGREMPSHWRFLDTLPLSRSVLKKSGNTKFTLDALREHYEITINEGDMMHRAFTDVKVLSRIIHQLLADNERANTRFSEDKVGLLDSYSFSLGDPGAGSLKRQIAAATSSTTGTPANQPWFSGGTTRTSTGGIADAVDAWENVRAMSGEDFGVDEDFNGGDDDSSSIMYNLKQQNKEESEEAKTRNRLKRPFWAQADPINGFAPPTLDFAKLSTTDENDDKDLRALRNDIDAWKETPIREAFGAGSSYELDEKTLKALETEGVDTVEAILRVCPRKYQEYSPMSNDLRPGTSVSLLGRVVGVQVAPFTRGRSRQPSVITLETVKTSETNEASEGEGWGKSPQRFKVKIWEYLTKDVKSSLTRDAIVKVRGTLGNFTGSEFSVESAKILTDAQDVTPIGEAGEVVATYAKKASMTNEEWHKAIPRALEFFLKKLKGDPLEVSLGKENALLKELQLVSHAEAVASIHAPATVEQVARARERLAFEELLILQVQLMGERKRLQSLAAENEGEGDKEGISIVSTHLCDQLRKELSFSLTRSQDQALEEILTDMAGPAPMLRLLQGDVGCGKTVVAALALLAAVGAGHQGALMAPTEVLANQHYKTLSDLLREMGPDAPKCEIITGSTKQKELKLIYEKIESGEISIVVGTTSLINENVKFKSLGLAVVDEQHRFGVNQRAKLLSKGGEPPHMLTMSATPIPRTLAMTKFGEMALSVIEEKPAGRLPIYTKVLDPSEHEIAFEAIQEETQRGGQAYVILRYVSDKDTEKNQTKGAEEEFERLKLRLPNVKFGLLHGQLSSEEKQNALDLFAKGETQCLVATSVVEVGVDVPNASLIVIDASGGGGSGGFGLAALHQLRGRVGRGSRQSRCFLLNTPNPDEDREERARDRLTVLEKTNDGFRVAESDLQLRGAGDLWGSKQSGNSVELFHASLATDLYLLESARKAAAELVAASEVEAAPTTAMMKSLLPAPVQIALEKRTVVDLSLEAKF